MYYQIHQVMAELLSSNTIRFFGSDGIDTTMYMNMSDTNDAKQFNIQISGLTLKNLIDNLTTKVNVSTLDITSLNTTISSGFTNRYTKSESDIRYYTKSEFHEENINYLYEYNAGLYKVLNLKHNFGINSAISSNQNPTSSEILLSMDLNSGVTQVDI